jgi:hypothetical protein
MLVLVVPQVGGAVVAAWLAGIVALRDFALLIGAIALVLLATRYSPVVGRRGKERRSGRRRVGPTVGS